jgi:predicted TIM-barrel fold metal-dependent hydrolase
MDLPLIISVDDHVIEPSGLWQERLPRKWLEAAPRLVRQVGGVSWTNDGKATFVEHSGTGSRECDVWVYDDSIRWPMSRGFAQIGSEDFGGQLVTYDEIVPGAFNQQARLRDMDVNGTEASLCFPTFARFCGQTFLDARDRELALACVQTYNDWMIEDWCGGAGHGRLIPLTLIPLWDPELAAAEVRRCAGKGSHAIAFSEQPSALGLPSIHSGHWDPLLRACEETETVLNMHIGSSSKMPTTSPDAPYDVLMVLTVENTMSAFVDWLLSGALVRHPDLKIAFSEGQVGWIPFFLERLDNHWERSRLFGDLQSRVPQPPSSYLPGRVYGCIFDDQHGLKSRDVVGMGQIMVETDYPHADSTFPHSVGTIEKMVLAAGLSPHEVWQLVRGNAIECYGLERFGISG